jgi:predicted dehydrogenase
MAVHQGAAPGASRRDFMKVSGALAAATLATGAAREARAAEGGEVLRVGLVGCGGRGGGAAREALLADPNTKLVALGDTFRDQAEMTLKKFKGSDLDKQVAVDDDHIFVGFDAYKQVIDACDVVVLAAAPGFRPAHLRAALESGKHVFCEKPIAVDPWGVRHVMESCALAREKKLNVVSGLCYRYENAKRDTIKRIQDGAIGDILTIQTTYNTGALWHKKRQDDWSDVEYMIRNWLYFDWLSGDHINEQHIHSLDKMMWVLGDVPPVKATSSGGRVQRTDPKFGNAYDHFNTVYEWESGVKAFSSCRQWESCSTDVSDHITGTGGTAELQSHTITPRGGTAWKHEKQESDNMYQNEHNALFQSIRAGGVIVDEYMCTSTLVAIMGRMAAYTGKSLSWEQVLNSTLNLVPETLEWGPMAMNPIAVPGETKLV